MIYDVTVSLCLLDDHTAAEAEMAVADLGDHKFTITADSAAQAEELALDRCNETVPIGMPEFVDATALAVAAASPLP